MVKKEAVSSSESSKANAVISSEAGSSQFAVQSRLSSPLSSTFRVQELCYSCGCNATTETDILSEDQ
jgi:hypothetical protein